MHLDIILNLRTLSLLASVTILAYMRGLDAYHVVLPETPANTTESLFLNFSLLPRENWTYTIRNIWRDLEKFDSLGYDRLASKGVAWWENSRNSLALDGRALRKISSTHLTVIIEAKSAGQVSIIPVTVHVTADNRTTWPADYPHVIQSYQSGQACTRTPHPVPLLNITNAIPDFVKQSNWQLLSDRKEQDSFLIHADGGVWPAGRFCDDRSQTTYYTAKITHDIPGGGRAIQAIDLMFASGTGSDGGLNQGVRPIRHRRRRHRKTRATTIYFSSSSFSASVLEEIAPPVLVVQMNVSSSSRPVKFSMAALADSRSQALFSIDSESGWVRTETQLDREAIAQHSFRITAVAEADRWTTATTTLYIKVLDVNDNVPIFEKTDYNISISESAAVGTVAVTVHAGDSDEGGNGQVSYTLINSKGKNEAFQIDAKNGVISTRLPLDREALESHFLYVKAEDGDLQQQVAGRDDQKKSSIAKIFIHVLDENDNTPTINATCNLALREDLDWTTLPTIVQLMATDQDSGMNGQIRYFIVGGNPNGQFLLDAVTGDLRVAAPLDYESERRYRLAIRIQDLGSPPRSNTTICTIDILDSNDNEPKFSTNMYSASLAEDVHTGYPVVQTQAYDPEGKIVYSIKNQSSAMDILPFIIDSDSGWITTSGRLDRERQERYEIEVIATDVGLPARSATAKVTVQVLDVNDNGPVFEQRNYNVSLSEQSLTGTQILSLRAQDRDLNARLTYQIVSGNQDGAFSVINQNGLGLILLSKAVHYRHAQRCELLVEVADESGKNDRVPVVVHVLPANLHRPTFLNAPFRIQIPENVPVGTTVVELKALTSDEDVGDNGRIAYSMSSDLILSDLFHLAAETGVLTTRKPLDREIQTVYTIPVTATDHGIPPLYDTTEVSVELIDVNDHAPVFLQKTYFVAVKEDVSPQTSILQVSAIDLDFGLNGLISYTLEGGNNNGTFLIDAALGIVRTNVPLDRELHAAYELTVLAVDRGTPPLTASVVISVKILDVNDNAPAFAGDVLNFYAPENLIMGSTVAEILASDPDEGANAAIEYYIIGGPDADSFALVTRPNKRPPLLTNLLELDYEGQKRHYKLVIRASSPPLQTDVTVNIYVTDVNDNAPLMKDFRIILNNYPHQFSRGGVIGKVPVTDRDVTAKLEYRITTGNRHRLLLIHPTNGDIQLSSTLNSGVPYSAEFTIGVSDGLNVVTAVCTLMTIPVDDEMLANSVTLQAANVTARDILEPTTYDRLVESLAFLSRCPPESIFIFGIIDEIDARIPVVNISFAAKLSGGVDTFLAPHRLKERLFVGQKLLQNMSITILPFDDSMCLREPCPNFEKCQAVQKFGVAPSRFTVTDTFFFRSVQPITTFQCECPAGFTGMAVHDSCDTEINMCYSSPCGGNGTCVPTEGGFYCNCSDGFFGKFCELDGRRAGCSEGICKSQPICSSGANGQSQCSGCPDNVRHAAPPCILTIRSFFSDKRSYMIFPGISSRNRFKISLSIATTKKSGLLIYNGRISPGADFMSLEIVNGSVHFSFSLGRDATRLAVPTIVADGEWHHVEVDYANRSVRVSVDHCDYILALKHGKELNYQCAAVATLQLDPHCLNSGALCHRFLDLTGPLYVGGLADAEEDGRLLSSRFFDGCMKTMAVDGRLLDMDNYIEEQFTSTGCRAKEDYCRAGPCVNGGTCINGWGKSQCKCPVGFSGDDCSRESAEEFQLDGDGYMLIQQNSMSGDSLDLQFDFRTRKSSGILLTALANDKTVLVVQIHGQYILVKDVTGTTAEGESRVTDGTWHRFRVTSQGNVFAIFIDGQRELELSSSASRKTQVGFSVALGGKESLTGLMNGFSGCLRGIVSQGRKTSLSFRSNVQDGCSSSQRHCQSSPCAGEFNQCIETGNSYRCECQKGYIGSQCKDICSFNPCKNGICVHTSEARHGYQCRCFSNFTGQYCEEDAPQACPASWWGYPVCGPCQCNTLQGFDPVCDKSSGVCHCKDGFYQLPNTDQCVSCDCSAVGSLASQCDTQGQCQCRIGVTGRKCHVCPSPYGELTDYGCEEVHGACPGVVAEDGILWWQRTMFGLSTLQPCPSGSTGTAVRACDLSTRSWSSPDFSNCSSLSFEVMEVLLDERRTGRLHMDSFIALRIIKQLRSALNATMRTSFGLYQRDLFTATELLSGAMEYELHQTAMNLTHRLDKNYLPALVECISLLFDSNTVKVWRSLSGGDTRSLSNVAHLFHRYIRAVAVHAEETNLRPFEIVVKNLKVGINLLSVQGISSFVFPNTFFGETGHVQVRFEFDSVPIDRRGATAGSPATVQSEQHAVPSEQTQFLLSAVGLSQLMTHLNFIVYYVEYPELPSLLTRTSESNHSVDQKFTSASRAFHFGLVSGELDRVLYEFRLFEKSDSPVSTCLSWDFSTGKWTRDGCTTLSYNVSHVNCSCLPELLVAVLTESHGVVNVFRMGVSAFLFNTVLVVLAIGVNFACLTILLATQSTSDSVRVAQNMVFAALTLDLTFLLVADLIWDSLTCKILAALLHYFFLSRLCWCLAHSIQLYQSAKRPTRTRIRCYALLGYGVPCVIVGMSVGLRPENYGTQGFCWMVLDDNFIMTFVGPVTGIVLVTLIVLLVAHCTTINKQQKDLGAFSTRHIRQNVFICTGVSMFFVGGLALIILAVNFQMTSVAYAYPACALCQSIFMLAFLCLKTAEVGTLMQEKVLWFVRRKVDSFTSRGKNSKMMDSVVRETYRNPGIIISDSTTYHRTPRPDKDISVSFGDSAASTMRRSNRSLPDPSVQPLNELFNDPQKESDETNEDTVSVHSSNFTQETQRSFEAMSVDRNGLRSPYSYPERNPHRTTSNASTFGGPPLLSWNSLPHSSRGAALTPKSPKLSAVRQEASIVSNQVSTFATFRPASKSSQNAGHIIDTVTGELLVKGSDSAASSQPSLLLPPEPFRANTVQTFSDFGHTETGTAV